MDDFRIESFEQLKTLWQDIYSETGSVDWGGMLPYYANDIRFKDSVQEICGKASFEAMTRRLAKRSKNLRFIIHNGRLENDIAFVEWEMSMSYKRLPTSSIYGMSRLSLRGGKVAEQRDYYDLWGDIYDNIPVFRKLYRWFMRRVFG